MTVTVLDSADLVQSVITGTVPVPKGIAEDNASQAAKREKPDEVPERKSKQGSETTTMVKPPEKVEEPPKVEAKPDESADDVEGEDGLTPRQKREYTASMLKTIAKQHRMRKEAEETAATEYNSRRLAEERAAKLERELARIKEQNKPVEVVEGPPDRAKFETEQAYQDAMVDYKVDQRFKEREAQDAKKREEDAQAEVVAHAAARIERAIELVPDFKEVTEAVDMAVPPHIASYMQESELFGEMGYHFAKHPEVLEKLADYTAGTTPGTQAFVRGITRSLVELGKIESTLKPFAPAAKVEDKPNGAEPSQTNGVKPSTETGSAPSKPKTQAPTIRPLSTGSASQVEKSPEDMSVSDNLKVVQRRYGVSLTARKRH
jgi:hypothetical protein